MDLIDYINPHEGTWFANYEQIGRNCWEKAMVSITFTPN